MPNSIQVKLSKFKNQIVLLTTAILFLFASKGFCEENNRNFSSIRENFGKTTQSSDFEQPKPEYYNQNYLRYTDFVYQNNIKSVLFTRPEWEFATPIIELNSDEVLELRFDDLDGDFKNYAYTIIHCNALWEPSELSAFEYISGFQEDKITEYSFSRNTRVSFTHYRLEFPNANMQPMVSGNYLLKVFFDGQPDELLLTRRFMVYTQEAITTGTIKQATNLDERRIKQEVDFTITSAGMPISNPYRDLRVVVTQNGRWDNAIFDLKPRLVQGNTLVYDFEDGNTFFGGNEFRSFNTTSLRYRSMNIAEILPSERGWDVTLRTDRSRQFLQYTTQGDINGKFLIKSDDYPDQHLDSDYAWVKFTLSYSEPLVNGNVYVAGMLTNWDFLPSNKMQYNYRDAQYELEIMLKQGYYEYQYIFLEDGKDAGDETLFEGSHSIAENEYAIYVYYRKPGDIFDSLISVAHLNTSM